MGKTRTAGGSSRPTIRDVAREARVAPTTVSAILNQREHCYASEQTRKRVNDVARKLGYRPNVLARALNGKRTLTIGLTLADFNTEMSTRKIAAVEANARKAGYAVITACNEGTAEMEDRTLQLLLDRVVDGVVVYPVPGGDHARLRQLVESGFPIVTFDGVGLLDFPTWDVSIDSVAAGRMQVEHLLERGCRRIAVVEVSPNCWTNECKAEGMLKALNDAGLSPADRFVVHRENDETYVGQPVFEQLREWLKRNADSLDGVSVIGDLLAMNVLRAAGELGIKVPDDLAVIGQDGIAAGEVGFVPLSTVTQDSEAIGRKAFEMLKQLIEGKLKGSPKRKIVKPRLIVRTSTAGMCTTSDSKNK